MYIKKYFSIIDIVEILTDVSIPKRYWSDLKGKLISEGSEVYEKIVRLKMLAIDRAMETYLKKGYSKGKTRIDIEEKIGKSVISSDNVNNLLG